MPYARRDDPWTSWAAAESLGDLRARQAAVAAVFDASPDGLTLEELVDRYGFADVPMPPQSDSGIRTRCKELARLGLIVDTGQTRPTRAGRQGRVLRLDRSTPRRASALRLVPPDPQLTIEDVEP